jgi:4-amino-4-deoxy-L-arabinose transferase-like glycosyltransferase
MTQPSPESDPAFFKRLISPGFEPTWRHAIALSLITLISYALIGSASTLFDRDEPRFAQATAEMLASGNYLYPTFNGNLRPDKPILIYWFMAASSKILGHTELAVRIWSSLGVVGAALMTFWMGKRLANSWVGLVAAAMMTTTPMFMITGTASTADGLLFFFITLAFAVFVRVAADPSLKPRWQDYALLTIALGGAQLTKGPVGIAIPLLGFAGCFFMLHRLGQATPRILTLTITAAVLGTALFFAWAIPADRATGGEFYNQGIGKHVIERTVSAKESHGGKGLLYFATLPLYIPFILAYFFPWTLLGFATLGMTWRGTIGSARLKALCIGWAAPTFILMSLVATKLPHYILPIWPAIALLTASALDHFRQSRADADERLWAHRGGIFFAPVAIGLSLVLLIAPWGVPAFNVPAMPSLQIPGIIIASLILLLTAIVLRLHLTWRFTQACIVLWAGVLIVQLALAFILLPAIEPLKLGPQVAKIVKNAGTNATPVATMDYQEASLDYYLNRPPLARLGKNDYATWAADPAPGILVLTRYMVEQISPPQDPRITEAGSVKGLNHSKGKPMEVVVLRKASLASQPPTTQPDNSN